MKKKILLLSDDLRSTSGVATMSRELVLGTVDTFDWVQLGAMINHPDIGKIIDLNDDVRNKTGVEDANVKIYPSNGYGDITSIRRLLDTEKPDAILHFTDPHYWQWLYDNEHEIRQRVPILFYHIWDNLPDPDYNRDYYESCDWLGCISKQTYGIVHRVGKIKTSITHKPLEDWQITYVPHGINENVFKPIEEYDDVKKLICGEKDYNFILFYNNRNIRRKRPSDIIASYKIFCDGLSKKNAEKCLLLLHTAPIDPNGTDLVEVAKKLCPDYDIKFSNTKIEQVDLNKLYNLADCTINIADNEGFGLATAESIMAGTPIIVNVTGGLQDQCGFNFTADDYIEIGSLHDKKKSMHLVQEGEWAFPVWPSSITLTGSIPTPYIYEDRIDLNEVAERIRKVYDLGRKKRKKVGLLGREYALENLSSKIMCNSLKNGILETFNNFNKKERYKTYKLYE